MHTLLLLLLLLILVLLPLLRLLLPLPLLLLRPCLLLQLLVLLLLLLLLQLLLCLCRLLLLQLFLVLLLFFLLLLLLQQQLLLHHPPAAGRTHPAPPVPGMAAATPCYTAAPPAARMTACISWSPFLCVSSASAAQGLCVNGQAARSSCVGAYKQARNSGTGSVLSSLQTSW
jgi:hypothetical protein